MRGKISRRDLLRHAGLANVGVWAFRQRAAWPQVSSPNERLNIAGIGVGGRGWENLVACEAENIVALCDVDERWAGRAFERFPAARRFRDFRRMFDQMATSIDAVVISTPDHTHAIPAAMAMALGKHCYCEKPLTHSVYESRYLTELAASKKVATQLGTQIHAGDNYRRVVELIQSGALGSVGEVHVWFAGGIGGGDRPKDTPPIPPELDWDLWLGPAPFRPYHPAYVPSGWRSWWDFGNGTLGDFGCHYMDVAFWALELSHPTRVEASSPVSPHPETTPPVLTVVYDYPARGDKPAVRLTWYHGAGNRPQVPELKDPQNWPSAVLFVGSKGKLIADYGKHKLLPEEAFADFQRPEPVIPPSIGHHREWLQACRTGEKTTCDFGYSGPLTESVLLGNVAFRTQSPLEWDWKNLRATNCPAADSFIRREYRAGWQLEVA